MISTKELKVAVIGGGTGLSTMLRGLKTVTRDITAIVAVSDDGGGSGVLRQELGMLPPGDVRNCLVALANVEPIMEKLLTYRFPDGGLSGQCFGNLFLAALDGISDSFDQAVSRMGEVLAITGRVLPVTNADVHLEAVFENGSIVRGESHIKPRKKDESCRIRRIKLIPARPPALPGVLAALRAADLIVIGPGSLYTSIIPNLLVEGVVETITKSDALKVYVCNVMTQEGETEGYTAADHLRALMMHATRRLVDVTLVNTAVVPDTLLEKYKREGAEPLAVDPGDFDKLGVKLIGQPLVSESATYARHDPALLTRALMALFMEERALPGGYAREDNEISDSSAG